MSNTLEAAVFEDREIRLGDLSVAPENPRAKEAADEAVPHLADTLEAAGVLHRLIVRPGRKGESPAMILSGRRRYLGLALLRAEGRVDDDYLVPCKVAMNKAAELAALFVSNEHVPVHVADVILAIGKLRKTKLDTAAIAKALGYDELEVRRLQALGSLHELAIKALRQGRINLRQARLLARLPDKKEQAEFARQALCGYMQDWVLANRVTGKDVTTADPRFGFVGRQRYLDSGGKLASDLFGELPEVVLDPDILAACWSERLQPCVEALQAAGLEVFTAGARVHHAPDGFELPPHVYRHSLPPRQAEPVEAAEAAVEATRALLEAEPQGEDEQPRLAAALLMARLAHAQALDPSRNFGAAILYPVPGGVDAVFAVLPVEAAPDGDEAADGEEGEDGHDGSHPGRADFETPRLEVDVEGRSHALHLLYTDVATRGLMRELADSPTVALSVVIAQLFSDLALNDMIYRPEPALKFRATRYRAGPELAELDGEVRSRLAARREAFLASGQRPIGWVDALPHGEKMALLAELVAVSLDLREPRTDAIRPEARAQAAEMAELLDADIAGHWTPDADFLGRHTKKQLLVLLEQMGVEDAQARTLKKDALAVFAAEQARALRWAPAALSWRSTEPAAAATEPETQDEEPSHAAAA